MVRANFFRCNQLQTNVFHQYEFYMVSMCLSRGLMATGKQSVPRCPAWRNQAGLGAIDGGGGVIFKMKRNRSPDAQIGTFKQDCGSSIF